MREAGVDLDPAVRTWLARIEVLSADLPSLSQPFGSARRAAGRILSDRLAAEFTAPAPPGVAVDAFQVPRAGGSIAVRRYRPHTLTGPAPTQVWLHGGGFHAGAVDEEVNDRLCATRAADAALQICSVDYRLAPEHPFPAAADDALAVIDALRADPAGVDADPIRIGIGGNSAGATIAASAALLAIATGAAALWHQDLEVVAPSLPPTRGLPADVAAVLRAYFGAEMPPPKASPLDEPDLSGLPPTLIMVAEHDPLRPAALAYARRLEDAGIPVTVRTGAGHLHGTPALTATFDAARRWQRLHARELARAYRTTAA